MDKLRDESEALQSIEKMKQTLSKTSTEVTDFNVVSSSGSSCSSSKKVEDFINKQVI